MLKIVNFILYLIFTIYIAFHKKNVYTNKLLNILFLFFITIICKYNNTIGILLYIIYIISFTKTDEIYETFSNLNKNGLYDLNSVLKFLKTPKSKNVLETMFIEK